MNLSGMREAIPVFRNDNYETRNWKLETAVMENLITRYGSVSVLAGVLFVQVVGLAVQVKRTDSRQESTRLLRVWAVSTITPFEKALVWAQTTTNDIFRNYFYLRGVRAENRELKQEIERLRLERVRLADDAEQARRLQLLLGFKEKFIAKTVAAQVIGSSGSEQSRSVYIDKGTHDGIEPDQAVVTADGVVGKVLRVFNSSSLVLLINDQTSGLGVILEKSRLQGVLRGTASGQVILEKIMSDEGVQQGEPVSTSGGDQIFPKGLAVGTVQQIKSANDSFLEIRVKPAANLNKLEEVLVVIKMEQRSPSPSEVAGPIRAVDVLTQRLPFVPDKPAVDPKNPAAPNPGSPAGSVPSGAAKTTATVTAKPGTPVAKPATQAATTATVGAGNSAVNPKPAGNVPSTGKPVAATAAPKPAASSPPGAANGAAKPTTTSAPGITPGAIKPAVVQKPVTPATQTQDKSAKPAPNQPKPDAPVEDIPQ
jgi:rod shape-determining protein MreC